MTPDSQPDAEIPETVRVPIARPADPFAIPSTIEVSIELAAHWDDRCWRERPGEW